VILYLENKIKNMEKPEELKSKSPSLFNNFNSLKSKDINSRHNILSSNPKKEMKKSCI
jgi:hypothetical protein